MCPGCDIGGPIISNDGITVTEFRISLNLHDSWSPIIHARCYIMAPKALLMIYSASRLLMIGWFYGIRAFALAGMMTSSNGNIFRVTGHLCGEFTGHRWILRTRPVTRSFDVFSDLRPNKRLSKQSRSWWFETPSHPLWRHCIDKDHYVTVAFMDHPRCTGPF